MPLWRATVFVRESGQEFWYYTRAKSLDVAYKKFSTRLEKKFKSLLRVKIKSVEQMDGEFV